MNVVLFVLGYFYPLFFSIAQYVLWATVSLLVIDGLILFSNKRGIKAKRQCPEKFSNGDEHTISVYLQNNFTIPVGLTLIDELPFQFQIRDLALKARFKAGEKKVLRYKLRPIKRGEYHFGSLILFITSPLGLACRRIPKEHGQIVPSYPAYLQLRKYDLKAISNRLTEMGIKKIRRLGNTTEFEQIKEYVLGDDIRTINWKATAKQGDWMVNHYQDERSQQIYNVLDMGRAMKMPFEAMSLLDYAINSALVLSNVALLKHDKAGLMNFSHRFENILPASRRPAHMQKVLEHLYKLNTNFLESNFEALYANLRKKVTQRSLIALYTNFENLSALKRQLPYLKAIAKNHLLLVIFFENTELKNLLENEAKNVKEVYYKVIAEKFAYEKKQIVRELQ
ncbi:DUF58 domain-containing protein, partial [Xanthovirga aplysinae]|uniref:DUF58 domain-containing protein n=1 Tax=Xanthovirga aplysinae TaxID=2529853 RepID=UPI0012BB722E